MILALNPSSGRGSKKKKKKTRDRISRQNQLNHGLNPDPNGFEATVPLAIGKLRNFKRSFGCET
jgi:hypothetical protein